MRSPGKEVPQDASAAADSVIALETGLRRCVFWTVALTFVWIAVAAALLNKLGWYHGAGFFYAYPISCLCASLVILTSARPMRLLFAALNFLAALAWGAFFWWLAIQFKEHPWK